MPSQSNENSITPGETESSHAHLPPPILIRDPAIRSHLDVILQRYREVEMAGGRFTPDAEAVIQSNLYAIIRRCGREEIHGKMSHSRQPPDQTNKAPYCLLFLNNVKDRIYPNNLVTAENGVHGNLITVAICDMSTQAVITTDPSLSSARVILTVLDADFSKNKRETWSVSEFNQSELMGRNGKGPILTGHSLIIQLENGVGTFDNICFNDNSSWLKDRSIRLGVMVEGEGKKGYLNGKRVQEGVSNPFRVLDRRSQASEKPKFLKLTDGVRSIRNIGQKRADTLKQYGIITVWDFLWKFFEVQPLLRQELCIKSETQWLSIQDQVKPCFDEFWSTYHALNNSSHPQQHANVESGNIQNVNSVQHTNVSGSAQIDPVSYLGDGLHGNTPFPMGFGGSDGDGDGA